MPKSRRKPKKNNTVRNILLVIVLVLVVVLGGIFGYGYINLQPVGDGSNTVDFQIEEGSDFDAVLNDLEDQNLIRSATVSKLYARVTGHQEYYAGFFELNDGMSTGDILSHIGNIENAKTQQVSITIPEGKWAKEIAASISEQFPYTPEEVLATWNDIEYIRTLANDYTFLDPEALSNENYKVKLEGYLFPETYFFDKDATIDEITRTLLNGFETIYEKYKTQFDNSSYSIHQLVSLASVVQFESGSAQEMPTIAQVFYNRLNQQMRLESSVTVCYALYDEFNDPQDCEVRTDIESPYNTYLNDGLPIGPILNPGEEAINAVLNPSPNDYLFFVADIYGDGSVYYSTTYEEHQARMEELGLVIE